MHLWDAEHDLGMARRSAGARWDAWRRSSTSCTRVRSAGAYDSLTTAVRLTPSDLDESIVIGDWDPVDLVAPAEVLLRTCGRTRTITRSYVR